MSKPSATPGPALWVNRIIRHSEEDPMDLLANPYNHRIHGKFQQASMEGVLDKIGFIQSVIVNQPTEHMIDGHMRVMLAMKKPGQKVPVTWVDLTPEEEAAALVTYDYLTDLAFTDKQNLDLAMRMCESDSEELMAFYSHIAETEKLYSIPPEELDPTTHGLSDSELSGQVGELLAADVEAGKHKLHDRSSFTLAFDNADQKLRFMVFIKSLFDQFPAARTPGARLDAYLQEHGYSNSPDESEEEDGDDHETTVN